jgi:hypothetical protein
MKPSPSRTPTEASRVQYLLMNLIGYWHTAAKVVMPTGEASDRSPEAVNTAVTRSPHLAPGAEPICSIMRKLSDMADCTRPRT